MPLRPFNRNQAWLLPPTLDELIPEGHAVRFIASIIDALENDDWYRMGIDPEGYAQGAPAYHPRALLGIWLYGFMTGTRSSRKLEIACRDQVPYLWLTGWQHPDHNTLWRFYKEYRGGMRHLFKMTVRTAVTMDLIDMAVQAVDGTKIQANASKDRTYDKKKLQRFLNRIDSKIQEMETQNEADTDSPALYLPEELQKPQNLRAQVKVAMKRLETEDDLKRVNLTDGDSRLMKSRQGIVTGYNIQAMVSPAKTDDNISGMVITAIDAVQDAYDHHQFLPMIEKSCGISGKKAGMTLADAG